MIIDGNKITADAGKVLTNGSVYSDTVYLGIHDSVSNWREIPDSEIPPEPPTPEELSKAAEYMLGQNMVELPAESDTDYLNEHEPEPDYFA